MVAKIYNGQPCAIDGCTHPPVTRHMCSMHYQRWKKAGDPLADKPRRRRDGLPRINSDGYIDVWAPGHPLARSDNYVAEHRKVLYDAGIDVPLDAHVHHVNGDKTDNRIENLEVLSPSNHALQHVAETDLIVNQCGVWPKRVPGAVCFLDGCTNPVSHRGLCNGHYLKWNRGRLEIDWVTAAGCGLR